MVPNTAIIPRRFLEGLYEDLERIIDDDGVMDQSSASSI